MSSRPISKLTVISAVLSVTTFILWGRSKLLGARSSPFFVTSGGRVVAFVTNGLVYLKIRSRGVDALGYASAQVHQLGFLWTGYAHMTWPDGRYDWWFDAPLIPFIVVFGIAPAIWMRRQVRFRREQNRTARNLCPKCGYDLRATPDRCPECGTVASNG